MFKMMLNAADRMVDKLRLKLSEKDRQIHDLQEEIKHLKQVIVDARMTESRLVATMEEGRQKHSNEMQRLKDHNCRLISTIHDLEYSSSQQFKHAAKEQLKRMESKLSMMSDDLDKVTHERDKVTHERDEMQRFIDTLPDGLRGAWSTYLMMKQGKDDDIG